MVDGGYVLSVLEFLIALLFHSVTVSNPLPRCIDRLLENLLNYYLGLSLYCLLRNGLWLNLDVSFHILLRSTLNLGLFNWLGLLCMLLLLPRLYDRLGLHMLGKVVLRLLVFSMGS